MKYFGLLILSTTITVVSLTWSEVSLSEEMPEYLEIPMVALLVDPEEYDGSTVTLHGVIKLEAHHSKLFLSKEYYSEGIFENSISIPLSRIPDEMFLIEGEYVRVLGRFRMHRSSDNSTRSVLAIDEIKEISKSGAVVYPEVLGENNIYSLMLELSRDEENSSEFDPEE